MKKIGADSRVFESCRASHGFSLLELLIVVAALSSVAAVGFTSLSGTDRAVKSTKLRQDVSALNTAVRAYLMSGGDLSGVNSGSAVIAKLKTTTTAASRSRIAGLRGTMLDLRLRGVSSSDSGVAKAVWDPAKKSFVIQSSGSGFSEFVLDPAAVPATLVEESRTPSLPLDSSDNWIWAFKEQQAAGSAPRAGTSGVATPVVAAAVTPSISVLQAPGFSKPSGLYPFDAFKPDLKVSLVDRNAANSAETYYSVSNGAWVRWNGKPLSIPRALATELRAHSAPLDPDRYEQSAVNSALYETIFFGGNSTGVFSNPQGDPGLASNLAGSLLTGGVLTPLTSPDFSWGSPGADFRVPNSLSFSGKSFTGIAPEQVFELGTFSYYNGSTYAGTNATSVKLNVILNLTTPGVVENLPFTFNLLSTPNAGHNADKDADYVYIPQVSTQFSTTIKGQKFYLQLMFGSNDGNGYTTIDVTDQAEEDWVQEVIAHRGKTSRNAECTPGYYNFEGEFNRRQDGNYNGGFPKYYAHLATVLELHNCA